MRESEELLTRVVRLVFTVMDGELLLEVLKLVEGLRRGEISLHGAVLFEVLTEDFDLNDEGVNVLDELQFEVSLVVVKLITDAESLVNKLIPLLLKVLALIKLITVHLEGVLDKGIHVRDGLELEVDVGLLLANLLEGEHDAAD